MFIKKILLENFRNYKNEEVEFSPYVNVFLGKNGQGKTNIAEAIYFLSTLQSHRVATKEPLIYKNVNPNEIVAVENDSLFADKYAIIRAVLADKPLEQNMPASNLQHIDLQIFLKGNNRARINGGATTQAIKILGMLKCVIFSPDDKKIVVGEPSKRRNFIDELIVQSEPMYASLVLEYSKILRQRTALLKSLFKSVILDGRQIPENYFVWTQRLVEKGQQITEKRGKYILWLNEIMKDLYKETADTQDVFEMKYVSSLDGKSVQTLYEHARSEIAKGVNLFGPHRDEIEFSLNGMLARNYASNGEQWNIALALKLSAHKLLSQYGNVVLLLDDVFSELDDARRKNLLTTINENTQTIITVASNADVPKEINAKWFYVENGTAQPYQPS
jgi:DNA replication and repair protein RecF